jgi:hypothetical protein
MAWYGSERSNVHPPQPDYTTGKRRRYVNTHRLRGTRVQRRDIHAKRNWNQWATDPQQFCLGPNFRSVYDDERDDFQLLNIQFKL